MLRATHGFAHVIRTRLSAIRRGHGDADGLDALCTDPAFEHACGRLPDTGVRTERAIGD